MKKTISQKKYNFPKWGFAFICLFFLLSIHIVKAQSCVAVTGDGRTIGNEVACGDEHFYVISNDGTNIKMLAKYNLTTGYDFYKMKLDDFTSSSYNGFYENADVQEKLKDGWYVADYDYDYINKVYSNFQIVFEKYAGETGTAVFFDTGKTVKEVYEDSQVRKYLNEGYYPDLISVNGKYVGVCFYKYIDDVYEYKAIFLDSSKISYFELYHNEDIQLLLDNGYSIYNTNYTSCSKSSNITSCDFYVVHLEKYKYEPYINLLADKEYASSAELIAYLKENTDYQKYIDAGYSYEIFNDYCGVVLYKNDEIVYPFDVMQNENAIGAHGDERGNPAPLERGIIQLNANREYSDSLDTFDNNSIYNGGYYDIAFNNNSFLLDYLNKYNAYLVNNDINIIAVDIMTVKDINNLVESITDSELPLTDWSLKWKETYATSSGENYYIIGSIKEQLPASIRDEYSWLWGTTYWLKTIGADANSLRYDEMSAIVNTLADDTNNWRYDWYMYFVDTLGDLCIASTCVSSVGAGIRPVVTINMDEIVVLSGSQTKIENPDTKDIAFLVLLLLVIVGGIVFVKNRKKLNALK